MRLLALLAAVLLSGCRPWCAAPPDLWTPSAYGDEARAVAEADAFLAGQVRLGRSRPAAELDAAARAVGAADAAELASLAHASCLPPAGISRFAAARGLSPSTAAAYLADRFGIAVCRGP